jgi:hypothetical protein
MAAPAIVLAVGMIAALGRNLRRARALRSHRLEA